MPRWLLVLRSRLRALTRRDVVSDEIREEVDFHIQRRIEHWQACGLSPDAARARALERFGNPAVIRDRGYDVRGGGLMESFLQDVKFGVRLLIKEKRFSLVALTTLALGIGATTAIFCLADAALVRPLPYDKPEQLVRLGLARADRPGPTFSPSLEDMDQWRSLTHVFSHVGAASSQTKVVVGAREPESISVELVSLDYLPMYGYREALGRVFTADDNRLGAPPVAMLGYRYWQTAFNGDPGAIGRTLQFSNDSATIVGVLSDDESKTPTKIFMPLQATDERRRARQYSVAARLKDGVTLAQAQRETDALFARLNAESKSYAGFGTRITPAYEYATRTTRPTINVLAGAVGFVLLIACVNVASLQLARGTSRQTELAVRASIGAGRGRLVRQLLTENVVLSVAGGALGVLLAWLLLDTLVANVPVSLPSAVTVGLNWRVLAAIFAVATGSGVLFGLLPAFRSSAADLNTVLGRASRGVRTAMSRAAGGTLVAVEIACAIVLVTGAALMARSFQRMAGVPLGFDAGRFITIEVAPVDNRPEVFEPFYAQYLSRVRELPGVEFAGGTNALPLSGNMMFSSVTTAASSSRQGVVVQQITPGYLDAIGVRLIAGRLPGPADPAAASWIVLSAKAAKLLFPGASPLGQRVSYNDTWREVIGVTGDIEANGPLRVVDGAEVFVGYTPSTVFTRSLTGARGGQPMVIVVAPRGNARGLRDALAQTAKAIGPQVIVRRIRSGPEWWNLNVMAPRQRTVLLGTLGALGLVLALVGVFGVTQFAVSRRSAEIGVRMAFGARPGQVVRGILRESTIPISAGIAAGLIGAFFLSKVISAFLFKTEPRDPAAFAAAALVLALGGVMAAWLPARRAAKVDPVIALRGD
jgi:putative ABC transport system permease protein